MRYNILSVDKFCITPLELSDVLRCLEVNFVNVINEVEALKALQEKKYSFNAVVWTVNYADSDDFEEIRHMKCKEPCKAVPILIVSKFTDKKFIIKAIESGAVEYIVKPYDIDTVLKKFCKVLGAPMESLLMGNVDEDIITFNFSEMFSREIKAASRGGHPLSIMLISLFPEDINFYVQKDLGEVTSLLNRVIKTKFRETDVSFHYGTNNVILLLPFTNKEGTKTVDRKIREIYDTHTIIKQKRPGFILLTSSVTYPEDGKVKDRLLEMLENEINEYIKSMEHGA